MRDPTLLHDGPARLRRTVWGRDHPEQLHRLESVDQEEFRGSFHRLKGELVRDVPRQPGPHAAFNHRVRKGRDEPRTAPAEACHRVEDRLLDPRPTHDFAPDIPY